MQLKRLGYFVRVFRQVRKVEGHLVCITSVPGSSKRRKVKASRNSLISSIIFTSEIVKENQLSSRMDLDSYPDLGLMSPPDIVRGMKQLDRAMFKKTVCVPTLKVQKQKIHLVVKSKIVSKILLKFRGIQSVVDPVDPNDADSKIILLNPNILKSKSDVDSSVQSELEKADVSLQSWGTMIVTLTYDNWSHRDILGAILPDETQKVSGFSQIGHVVHLNLKSNLLEYKTIIGDVMLDKIKTAKTVVNKTGIIDNTFRNFQMEVVAGVEDFVTVTHECGAHYKMDFSKVYWNPRLGFEHGKIRDIVQPGDVVFDMFAGIGPFSIPAAKNRCVVFANDLNPESYKWLNDNITRNKVADRVSSYNLDGRDFANTVIAQELPKLLISESSEEKTVHILMNLPAIAVEFTDVFPGLLKACNLDPENFKTKISAVRVYCYCFCKETEYENEIRQRLEQSMGKENVPDFEVIYVRNVAPSKEMYRVMFPLSLTLLTKSCDTLKSEGESTSESLCKGDRNGEPPDKKIKSSM